MPTPRKALTRPATTGRTRLVARETYPIPVAIHRYRVLFTDGVTVDFLSYSDHSGIRAQMLDLHFGKRPATKRGDSLEGIAGVADLGPVYVHTPQVPLDEEPVSPDGSPE